MITIPQFILAVIFGSAASYWLVFIKEVAIATVLRTIMTVIVCVAAAFFWLLFTVLLGLGELDQAERQTREIIDLILTLLVVSGLLWLVWKKWW